MAEIEDRVDHELASLLDLNEIEFKMDKGYWIKIEAVKVKPTLNRPHGVKYSLTLHDRNNTRVLGFDNAHRIKVPKRKKYSGRILTFDHKHKHNKVYHYEFESPAQLLEDFYREAEDIMSVRS